MSKRFFSRFVFALALAATPVAAPAQNSGGDYVQLSKVQSEEMIAGFRNYRLRGDACFDFAITHRLQREDTETKYNGTIWLSYKNGGPIYRVEIRKTGDATAPVRRFILQSGPKPALWVPDAAGNPVRSADDALKPLFPGLIFTPFELQTPFTYWPEKYLQTRRFRGRPTHVYKMTPPAEFAGAHPEIGYVNLAFDRTYNALMQAVIFDKKGDALRQLDAESFQKVQEQYVPEEIRLRDEKTRDKDIFRFENAALNLKLPAEIFEPATLNAPAARPAAEKFTKLD